MFGKDINIFFKQKQTTNKILSIFYHYKIYSFFLFNCRFCTFACQ